ncbi:MAG: SRPBCC family protein [Nitriliruptorales bacterium]
MAREETLVAAPPHKVMQVIGDFERYPDWAQNVKEVEVRERDEAGRPGQVWYRVDAWIMDITYVLAYAYEESRLTWHLVEGEQLEALTGEYLLVEEGGSTRVHYTLEVDVAFPLPGFLKQRAAKLILETGLGDLKRRVESLA